jgi:hypothetical protein
MGVSQDVDAGIEGEGKESEGTNREGGREKRGRQEASRRKKGRIGRVSKRAKERGKT